MYQPKKDAKYYLACVLAWCVAIVLSPVLLAGWIRSLTEDCRKWYGGDWRRMMEDRKRFRRMV